MKINRKLYALPVMTVAALLAAACSGGSGNSGSNITIRAILPPNTGPISSPQNASLQKFTQQYESSHPNVSNVVAGSSNQSVLAGTRDRRLAAS